MRVLDQLTQEERRLVRAQKQPEWAAPTLATLTDDYFSDAGWIFERKLDGERALALRVGGSVRLSSRNRKDLAGTYPEVVEGLERDQPAGSQFMVDGEIVAFEGQITSFTRLQGRMQKSDPKAARATGIAVFYYVFDLLHLDGYDVTALPLRRRKSLLRRALSWTKPLRYTPHRNREGEAYLDEACRKGWEGVIAKRATAPYQHSRSTDWLKFKCVNGQELVIGGYTDPQGARQDLGALLLGYHDERDLVYAGKVGTGFDEESLHRLAALLQSRHRDTSPFDRGAPSSNPHWVTPDLVCEVAFTEWTAEGHLRHPRYLGLRRDKDPADVVREQPRRMRA